MTPALRPAMLPSTNIPMKRLLVASSVLGLALVVPAMAHAAVTTHIHVPEPVALTVVGGCFFILGFLRRRIDGD